MKYLLVVGEQVVVVEKLEGDRPAGVQHRQEAACDARLAHFGQNGGFLLLIVALEEHLPQSVPAHSVHGMYNERDTYN